MHTFHVPGMTCGHCASTIGRALRAADPACEVEVALPLREVRVRSTEDRATLAEVLAGAGYPPAPAAAAGQ